MDKKDIKILEILQADARSSASDISKKVELSVPSVSDRIRKLNESIIKNYSAILNHKEANLDLTAFIFIVSEHSDHYDEFIKKTKKTKEATLYKKIRQLPIARPRRLLCYFYVFSYYLRFFLRFMFFLFSRPNFLQK